MKRLVRLEIVATWASLALLLSTGATARAQQADEAQTSTIRGTQKVQTRSFDPFDVSSRFTLNPFGSFTAASTPLKDSGTGSSETATTPNSGTGSILTSGSLLVVPLAAPPPFRPPVRSPFRPPPRPPYFPL